MLFINFYSEDKMIRHLILFFLLFSASLYGEMHVLAVTGSTRENSLNTQLLEEAASLAAERGANVKLFNLKGIPLYDGDLESRQGLPKKIQELRGLMIDSDLIMIASPEYNGSVTGVLKNALDWASRSEKGGYSNEAFKGKLFFLMSASPGQGGGARSLKHLREILKNLGALVVETEITVPHAQDVLGNHEAPYYVKLRETLARLIPAAD